MTVDFSQDYYKKYQINRHILQGRHYSQIMDFIFENLTYGQAGIFIFLAQKGPIEKIVLYNLSSESHQTTDNILNQLLEINWIEKMETENE